MQLKFAEKAISYEEKILKTIENEIVKECVKNRNKERQEFLYNCGYSRAPLEKLRTPGAPRRVTYIYTGGKKKSKAIIIT